MHSRSPSDSHRVNVYSATSSSSSSSSIHPRDSLPRPRRRPSSHGHAAGGLSALGHGAAAWLTGRVGRTGLRRWMLVAGVCFAGAVWVSSSSTSGDVDSASGGSSWSLLRSGAVQDADSDAVGGTGGDPLVDRTALEKLRLLEIHFGADEEEPAEDLTGPSSTTRRLRDPDAPPLVAEIPEAGKPNPAAVVGGAMSIVPAEVLDEETCGAANGEGCQFLVPAWLGEQETKAQQHLYQLGLLALALNRTLVLPNVSKSRLGCCYKNPFDFYYSPSSLTALGIPTISQDAFVAWTQRRDPPPSAQVVSMVNAKATYTAGAIEIDSSSDPHLVPAKPSRNLCLRAPRTKLDFTGHSPLAIYPPEGFHKSEDRRLGFGESVINTLRSKEVGSKSSRASSSLRAAYALPDVLAFNYELRFPILSPALAASFAAPSLPSPSSSSSNDDLALTSPDEQEQEQDRLVRPEPLPFAHFPYAPTWQSLGAHLASSLSPFIAIHWRTETLTPANLAPCAQSLLAKLLALKAAHPSLQNVYLATDYPIEALDASFALPSPDGESAGAALAHSGTFAKVVTEQHHAAMRRFLRTFDKQAKGKLRLTTFAREANSLRLPPALAEQLHNLTTPLSPPPTASNPSPPALPLFDPSSFSSSALLARLPNLDSGLLGILDKEVALRAEVFLTGVPGVGASTAGACAKLSSFTNQLVGGREGVRERQRAEDGGGGGEGERDEEGEEAEREERFEPGRLWNSVAHFSLSGEEVD
ncbi:hypothetical protein JCM6882_004662 [Rhodosporidiobolus microsporus]